MSFLGSVLAVFWRLALIWTVLSFTLYFGAFFVAWLFCTLTKPFKREV